MKIQFYLKLAGVAAIILFLSTCKKDHVPPDCINGGMPTVKVFATGFNSPRGLKFGPDGDSMLAEAGNRGIKFLLRVSVLRLLFLLVLIWGSLTGGRVSKVNRAGVRTTLTDQLPSSVDQEIVGGDFQGVADVACIGGDLYALLAGAGCSHGIPSSPNGVPVVPNGVVKIRPDGTWTLVANLSVYTMTHPTAHPEPHGGAEPDGTPYAMINVDGNLYVTEPNQGDFVKITPNGEINRVVDISVSQGHIVPTAVTFLDNNFLVGNLDTFPVVAGRSEIYRISPDKSVQPIISGFTTILGVVHDDFGRLYILENSTVSGMGPTPGTGDVVRVNYTGKKEVIVSGLSLPTGLTFGPDGKLYHFQ